MGTMAGGGLAVTGVDGLPVFNLGTCKGGTTIKSVADRGDLEKVRSGTVIVSENPLKYDFGWKSGF